MKRAIYKRSFWTALLFIALVPRGAAAVSNEDCLTCHDDPSLVNEEGVVVYVNPEVFQDSIHGQAGIECADCHMELYGVEDFPHEAPLPNVECAMCHDAEYEDYEESIHGEAFVAGDPSVPGCATCHGTHDIKETDHPQSSVFPLNLVDICIECHTDTKITSEHDLLPPEEIRAYENSVHMKALREKGLTVSAACNDCHGSHKIKPSDNPDSITNRLNIPKTCAQCHLGIYQTYLKSVHGQDYLLGNQDVPICTDCHGEHSIKSHTSPESSVYATHIAEICSNCHEDETLSKRYGFSARRLKTYLGTYHGIAMSLGDVTVANCASCHGYHDIRPANDPESSIHPDNIPETCGKCHPQAGKNFAVGKVHVAEARESSAGAYFVEKFYTIFIIASLTGFLVFIMVDLYARRKRAKAKRVSADAATEDREQTSEDQ
jgi:hypothetical protein